MVVENFSNHPRTYGFEKELFQSQLLWLYLGWVVFWLMPSNGTPNYSSIMLGVWMLLFSSVRAQVLSAQPASVDSVVQIVADEGGLQQATALPRAGTYWVLTTGRNGSLTALPYPFLPANLSALPIYSVAGSAFLVDETGGQVLPRSSGTRMSSAMISSTLTLQSQEVANLIEQAQAVQAGFLLRRLCL